MADIAEKRVGFPHGVVVATAGVAAQMEQDPAFALWCRECFFRHLAGDWGDLGTKDKALNDAGLVEHGRLLSAYTHEKHPKIWIITEYDRSVTTTLFPEEY